MAVVLILIFFISYLRVEINFSSPLLYFVLIKQYFGGKRKLFGIEFVKLDWQGHSGDMC